MKLITMLFYLSPSLFFPLHQIFPSASVIICLFRTWQAVNSLVLHTIQRFVFLFTSASRIHSTATLKYLPIHSLSKNTLDNCCTLLSSLAEGRCPHGISLLDRSSAHQRWSPITATLRRVSVQEVKLRWAGSVPCCYWLISKPQSIALVPRRLQKQQRYGRSKVCIRRNNSTRTNWPDVIKQICQTRDRLARFKPIGYYVYHQV